MKKIEKELKNLYAEKDIFTKYGVAVPQELTDLISEKESIKNKPKRKVLDKYTLVELIKEKLELIPNKTLYFKKPRTYLRISVLGAAYDHLYEYDQVNPSGFSMGGHVLCGGISNNVDIKTLRFLNKKLDNEIAKQSA